jgi:TPR repeat protein
MELYEMSSDLGDHVSSKDLAKIYEMGLHGVEKDLEKAAHFYFKSHIQSHKYYRDNSYILFNFLSRYKIEWKTEYHLHWNAKDKKMLNEQIITLLLVCKHRNQSSFEGTKNVVKGIGMKIIRFLCHFQQKEPKSEK